MNSNENIAVFSDAGFACLHTDAVHTERDLCVMARASKFGSDSHRHADQGSFAIFFGGKAFISPSGYFGRGYGTRHHQEWTKTTRAHNAILVDGEGQAVNSMESRGRILSVGEWERYREMRLDLSEAYPSLLRWERVIRLYGACVEITDEIEAEDEVEITYPLHTLALPKTEGKRVTVTRGDVTMRITPTKGELELTEITDRYAVDLNEGVPAEFAVTMPQQYHIFYTAPRKRKHRICVRYEFL